MRTILIFSILLLAFGCKKTKAPSSQKSIIQNDTLRLSVSDISKINYLDFGIDFKAKSTIENWTAYNTISNAINEAKLANFDFFVDDQAVFITTIQDIETTIPEKIASNPIKARILVLKTKLFKVKEAISLGTIEKRDQLITIKELFQAFSNVTLQINKKFEKEAQNIIKPD